MSLVMFVVLSCQVIVKELCADFQAINSVKYLNIMNH